MWGVHLQSSIHGNMCELTNFCTSSSNILLQQQCWKCQKWHPRKASCSMDDFFLSNCKIVSTRKSCEMIWVKIQWWLDAIVVRGLGFRDGSYWNSQLVSDICTSVTGQRHLLQALIGGLVRWYGITMWSSASDLDSLRAIFESTCWSRPKVSWSGTIQFAILNSWTKI